MITKQPVYNAILSRRSIRKFLNTKVSREQIDRMLRAAMAAPSACNLQPWAFVVVDEEPILKQLKETTHQGHYNAPLALVVCGIKKHIPWEGDGWMLDCGMAIQNVLLSCVEMNLASVCVGGFDEQALKQLLNIPEDVFPVCIVEIGYPAVTRAPKSWYTADAVYEQTFDPNRPRKLRTLDDLKEDIKKGII